LPSVILHAFQVPTNIIVCPVSDFLRCTFCIFSYQTNRKTEHHICKKSAKYFTTRKN